MGHAYEQYTATYLKRVKGQFFTNRLIIDLLVSTINLGYSDLILDPAGGSGGFLTGAMRYVRRKILEGPGTETSKQRQLDRHRTRFYMVEISRRLVKVAKTAMILNGDGPTGMTAGDSLGDYTNFDRTIVAQVNRGSPTIILTNPPFAGVGEGRVIQADVLQRFECGKRWSATSAGYAPTGELVSDGAPPEMLFFERCLDWLAPGGKIGIVMPKSFLDTQTYRPARTLLFRKARLMAVINCHKNTFQPHTGVRTCLLLLQKHEETGSDVEENYKIFMAISRKVGQDSEGVPIYKRDAQNNITDEIDEDLSQIGREYQQFEAGNLVSSGYYFSIKRNEIDEHLRINPQMFLPHLNETLEAIEMLDGSHGWSVSALSQIEPGIKIFKGPRFKSENIIVEEKTGGVEPYFTPSAILQEKSDSVKFINTFKATKKQLATINAIRVQRGDIVITRSGSIGRISYITSRYDNAIVSDDLIRVRIKDENLGFYIYQFLQSKFAQDQMLRNEYGAIQQHLEPDHIRNILVPIPDDSALLSSIVTQVQKSIRLKEEMEKINRIIGDYLDMTIEGAIEAANSVGNED